MAKIIELDGYAFTVDVQQDNDASLPWGYSDGHGPVSDWVRQRCDFGPYPRKRPGQRVLCDDGYGDTYVRIYDWQEANYIAKRDGWGLGSEHVVELRKRLGREPTKGEIRTEAVQRDFDYLRRWCEDDRCYVGIIVTLLDTEGRKTEHTDSLWGIESDDESGYHDEVARDCAHNIISAIGGVDEIVTTVRLKTMAEIVKEHFDRGSRAFGFDVNYYIATNGERVLLSDHGVESPHETKMQRTPTGRCKMAVYVYPDQSKLTFRWSDKLGGRVSVERRRT